MATKYTPKLYKEESQGGGGLAKIYIPASGKGTLGYVNVLKDYQWTLSPPQIKNTAPAIILKEYQVNESAIKRQLYFYGTGVANAVNANNADILSPYDELFPKDKPTGFVYQFPYLTDVNFQVNTSPWESLDKLEQGQKFASSVAGVIGGQGAADVTNALLGTAGNVAMGALAVSYPKVGIMDRPKLFSSHEFRTTEIKFSLFNTYTPGEWVKNRELCWLFVNQNLFNKRDFITSVPPVFYELYIPGQHYSIASCVTNITVLNRGNMRRMIYDNMESNVPDVFDVSITLTDMVMPSKNLFQTLNNPKVTSKIYTPDPGEFSRDARVQAEVDKTIARETNNPSPGSS